MIFFTFIIVEFLCYVFLFNLSLFNNFYFDILYYFSIYNVVFILNYIFSPFQFLSPEEEDPFLSNTLPGESKDIKRPGEDWRHMEGPKVPLSEVRTFKFHFFSTHISILFLIKFWY